MLIFLTLCSLSSVKHFWVFPRQLLLCGKESETDPITTAWLVLSLLHKTLMLLRCSLRSASCPTSHLQANSLASVFVKSPHFVVILCSTYMHFFSHWFFYLQIMYSHHNLLMNVLFVARSLSRSSCRETSFIRGLQPCLQLWMEPIEPGREYVNFPLRRILLFMFQGS